MLQEDLVDVKFILGSKWKVMQKPKQSDRLPGVLYHNQWSVYVKLLNPKLYGGVIGNLKLVIDKVRFGFYNQDAYHDEENLKG